MATLVFQLYVTVSAKPFMLAYFTLLYKKACKTPTLLANFNCFTAKRS